MVRDTCRLTRQSFGEEIFEFAQQLGGIFEENLDLGVNLRLVP